MNGDDGWWGHKVLKLFDKGRKLYLKWWLCLCRYNTNSTTILLGFLLWLLFSFLIGKPNMALVQQFFTFFLIIFNSLSTRFRSIGWIWIYNCCLILVFLIYGFERVHLDKNIGLIVGSNNGAHFDQYQTDKTIKKFAANSIQY